MKHTRIYGLGLFIGTILGITIFLSGLLSAFELNIANTRHPRLCTDLSCVQTINNRINLGDEHSLAVEKISSDAWYHGICTSTPDKKTDIFLFGPKHQNRVYLLVLDAKLQNGQFHITQIGSMNNSGIKMFARCLPSNIWDSWLLRAESLMITTGVIFTIGYIYYVNLIGNQDRERHHKLAECGLLTGSILVGMGMIIVLFFYFIW